jgi:hypothetical protein
MYAIVGHSLADYPDELIARIAPTMHQQISVCGILTFNLGPHRPRLLRNSREIVEAVRPSRRATFAWSSPALEEVRSPPAPQMRETGRTAASLMAETLLMACRLPFGTISFLQPATYQLGPQHPHSSYLPQSQPRTAAADLVLPPPGDPMRTMAPDQTDPNAACAP